MSPDDVSATRDGARRLVRELGFLDGTTLGLPHAQCHALLEIERAGECTVSALAELLVLDKSSVSRTVQRLVDDGLVKPREDGDDARKKTLGLTAKGKRVLARVHRHADERVTEALADLADTDRVAVVRGLDIYARALRRARLRPEFTMRPIRAADDRQVAALIRTVMPEYGASGPGFAIEDPEVDAMSAAYRGSRAGYWVVTRGSRVVGGAGFAALTGGDDDVCELRKMYFLREARGLGLGATLLGSILEAAAGAGFRRCYLETLGRMTEARRLYEAFGFTGLPAQLGATGHFSCDAYYVKELQPAEARSRAEAASDPATPRRRDRRR